MMVANKTDVVPYESLPAHTRAAIEEVARNCNAELIPASNISEENISKLKMAACDKLLEARYVRTHKRSTRDFYSSLVILLISLTP